MSRLVRILVSLGLLALVLAFADWRAVWQVLREVDLRWAGGVLLAAVVDRLITNYRWQILLRGRGVVIGYWRLFKVQLAANFIGAFLPGFIGVDAVRIAALSRSGGATASVFAATLVDRMTLAAATVLAGAMAVLLLAHERIPSHIVKPILWLALLTGLAMCLVLLPAVRGWMRRVAVPQIPERIRHRVIEVAEASLAFRRQRGLALQVGIATVVLFAVRLAFAKAVALACGADLAWADLALVIPLLWVVVMLPITIGGIGVQDAGYVVLMALVGISAPVAVSMSLVEHVLARLASLPGALFLGSVTERQTNGNPATADD